MILTPCLTFLSMKLAKPILMKCKGPYQMKTKYQALSGKRTPKERLAQAKRMKRLAARGMVALQTKELTPERRAKIKTDVHNLSRMAEIQRFRAGVTDGTA
jgi:hypothetical protein